MSTDATSTAQATPQSQFQDCLQCRVVGTATFAGLGVYSFMQARRSTPGTWWEKRIAVALGTIFCAGAVVRWTNWGIPGARRTETSPLPPTSSS